MGGMKYGNRLLLGLLFVCAATGAWGLYARHWIRQRNEMLYWALPPWQSNLPTPKGVTYIQIGDPGIVPWYLRIWGQSNPLVCIHIELPDVSNDDLQRIPRLNGLFPEAEVIVSGNDPRGKTF